VADDVAQEALLRAWRRRDSCRDPERPWAWLAQITRNEAIRHAARQPGAGDEPPDVAGGPEPPDAVLPRLALQDALARAEDAEKRAADLEARLAGTADELEHVRVDVDDVRDELQRVLATRTMRWSKQARAVYGRLRDLRPRRGDG
jgi:DNA-directed RNA polymerase specialized sigma24 family protein